MHHEMNLPPYSIPRLRARTRALSKTPLPIIGLKRPSKQAIPKAPAPTPFSIPQKKWNTKKTKDPFLPKTAKIPVFPPYPTKIQKIKKRGDALTDKTNKIVKKRANLALRALPEGCPYLNLVSPRMREDTSPTPSWKECTIGIGNSRLFLWS